MFKNRAIFNGELSEVFGADALPIDRFSRTIGYKRIATETWSMMST
jgi:acyl-homoserine lactone acylase PvdQ